MLVLKFWNSTVENDLHIYFPYHKKSKLLGERRKLIFTTMLEKVTGEEKATLKGKHEKAHF